MSDENARWLITVSQVIISEAIARQMLPPWVSTAEAFALLAEQLRKLPDPS